MFRLSPNLSLLYTELPFTERFRAARNDGFDCVEFWSWGDPAVVQSTIAATGLAVSVINVNAGQASGLGELANPDACEWWQAELDRAVQLALEVGCTTVNCLTGNRLPRYALREQFSVAADNLARGLDRWSGCGVDLVLEPLCADRPRYLVHTIADALTIHEMAGRPEHLRLQFDCYHLHQAEARALPELLCDYAGLTKHVQIADCPGRHEPGSGDIPWAGFLAALHAAEYDGWVGLEYSPTMQTSHSLRQTASFLGTLPLGTIPAQSTNHFG